MNRRWQADGIPFWRKLFSSNWWWYGEVNPDPASLPPPENRPKFWRGDVVFLFILTLGIPTASLITTEINARYWPFNKTNTYSGRIVETRYRYPQLLIELSDKKKIYIGFPMSEAFGLPDKGRPVDRWAPMVDRLKSRQYDCPNQLLTLDAQPLNFTLRPFLNLWEVRCASGPTLIPTKEIIRVWTDFNRWVNLLLCSFSSFALVFIVSLIIRRERNRYVKD